MQKRVPFLLLLACATETVLVFTLVIALDKKQKLSRSHGYDRVAAMGENKVQSVYCFHSVLVTNQDAVPKVAKERRDQNNENAAQNPVSRFPGFLSHVARVSELL